VGRADLHIHTTYSDGEPTVQAVLAAVGARRTLAVIAITDHDTIAGAQLAQRMMARHQYPFELIVGEEITSREGHIVGLFLREAIVPGMGAAETIAAIHAQGGLAFAPHPFFNDRPRRSRRTMDGVGTLAGTLPFDAIEVDNSTPFLERANLRARRFAACHRRPALGASDAHILAAIGKSYTTFPGNTAADLRRAIETGACQVGTQPYRGTELLDYFRFWLGYGRGQRATTVETGIPSLAGE
jgi:predicted metal-dependent phosphoesterase TrpH